MAGPITRRRRPGRTKPEDRPLPLSKRWRLLTKEERLTYRFFRGIRGWPATRHFRRREVPIPRRIDDGLRLDGLSNSDSGRRTDPGT